jgi:putative SOS response-associated peptidase YedK
MCFSSTYYPKSDAPVIGPGNKVSLLKWGFPMIDSSQVIFNARAESLEVKALYKKAIKNRCLIPATSFFEWDKSKTKYEISVENTKLFYFAGLWKEYMINGTKLFFYTIITTEPNAQLVQIHNRMPAIIEPEHHRCWLEDEAENALELLKPHENNLSIQTAK